MSQITKSDIKSPKAAIRTLPGEAALVYQPGFGNHFVTESVPGALPVGRNSPQRPPLRPLCRADLRHLVYHGARRKPAHLDLPHPAVGRASPVRAHRQRHDPQRARSTRSTRRRRNCAGARCRFREKPADFVEGIVTFGGNGDVATQVGMAVHVYAANRSMSDRCFYNADGEMLIVPQQGRARFVTELGVIEAAPRRDRGDPARLALSRRAAGRPLARLHLRELRRRCSGCRSSGPLGANGLANARDFLSARRGLRGQGGPTVQHGREIPGQPVGGGDGPFAAQRRRLARQFRALQIRSGALQRHRHDQFRSSRSVDLHRADRAVGPAGHREHRLRRSSRRAGSSARIRSGRPGSTATS